MFEPTKPYGDQTQTQAFKDFYGDWQNAAGGAENGNVDGRGNENVNAVQQPVGLGVDTTRRIAVGSITFPGASGPVGADGKPVVFFHGTRDNIHAFDTQHPNRKDFGWLGGGVYVASDPKDAETYSRMKRGNGSPVVMPLFVSVKNPFVVTKDIKAENSKATQEQIDRFTQDLKNKGHDGAVMAFSDGHIELVAFKETQIKSAIGNNGNFDGTKQGIVESPSGDYTTEAPRKKYKSDNQGDLFNDQIDLFLNSQPDESQGGEAVDEARRDAGAAVHDLHATSSILAQALSSNYAARQRTNLVGQTVGSNEDLATLAQVYRDPRFETFRVVFTGLGGSQAKCSRKASNESA